MAVYDGFFDFDAQVLEATGKYDREYSAGDFTGYFGSFIGSGVCVYRNPDSMKVSLDGSTAWIAPGYLFIDGYWLANVLGPEDDPETFKGYSVMLPIAGEYAVVARLDHARSIIELTYTEIAESYPDCLVLAYVNSGNGTVTDTRGDMALCGEIDALGDLSAKVQYAVNYIDNEIEDRLSEAQQQIEAQEAVLTAEIAKVAAQVEKLAPPPVGTVKFTASQNVGEEWLRCDGSFVTEDDYPELVAALGKHVPKPEEFRELANGDVGTEISNGVIYNNKFWVYSLTNKTLYNFDLDSGYMDSFTVSGADLLYSPSASPIYLSIVNGAVFLTQWRTGVEHDILVYAAYSFQNAGNTIETSRLVWDDPTLVTYTDFGKGIMTYVVYDEVEQCYKMVLGTSRWTSGGGTTSAIPVYLKWKENNEAVPFEPPYSDAEGTTYWIFDEEFEAGKPGFNKKNHSEIVFASAVNIGGQISKTVQSATKHIYHFTTGYKGNGFTTDLSTSAVAMPTQVMFALIKEYGTGAITVWYLKEGEATVSTNVKVNAGSMSHAFEDAAVYIAELNVWLMFLGTGLLFTSDLANASQYGFFDTTDILGVITQYGYIEYDTENRTLYISGQSSEGIVKIGALKMPALYNYASDGSWLPHLASDGVPAYIKAKEDKVIADPVDISITVTNAYPQYFDVILNGNPVFVGSFTRQVSESGKFKVGVRRTDEPGYYSGTIKVKVNNTVIAQIIMNDTYAGDERTKEFISADFIASGITVDVS